MRKVPSPSCGRLMPWVCRCSMMLPEDLKPPDEQPPMPRERAYVERTSEIAYRQSDSLPAAQSPNQDRATMARALRRSSHAEPVTKHSRVIARSEATKQSIVTIALAV